MLLSVEEKSRFFVHIFEKKQLFAIPKFGKALNYSTVVHEGTESQNQSLQKAII